jgi:hypothetical protein
MDSKAEAKSGGGAKGGSDAKGGDAKGSVAESKSSSSGRRLDDVASDADLSKSSGSYGQVKSLACGDVCIVKRSDGNWRYGRVLKWEGILVEVEVDDDENTKMLQIDEG